MRRLICAVASQSSGRRRRVLSKIRAKREMTVKTEDSDNMLMEQTEDHGSRANSGSSQTNMDSAISLADEKSLLAEYALYLLTYKIRRDILFK